MSDFKNKILIYRIKMVNIFIRQYFFLEIPFLVLATKMKFQDKHKHKSKNSNTAKQNLLGHHGLCKSTQGFKVRGPCVL